MLTLYAVNELSADQKMRVDEFLAGDASLQAELARILEAQTMIQRELSVADQTDPMPISAGSAVRAVTRTLKQRRAEELARPMKLVRAERRRWMVMLYPAGVAAAILGFGIYKWSRVQDPYSAPAPGLAQIEEPGNEWEHTRRVVAGVFPDLEQPNADLDSVESEINALAEWSMSTQ